MGEDAVEKTDGAQAQVTFKGQAAEVLNGIRKFQKGEEPQSGAEKPKSGKDLLKWIAESLSEPTNYVVARREYPKMIHGRELVNEIKMPCPTNIKEISARIEREMGGEKWWIQVFDSTGGEIVGRYITIDAQPVPQFKQNSGYNGNLFGMGDNPLNRPGFRFGLSEDDGDDDDDDDDEEMMNRMIKEEMKALRLKRIKKMMKEEDDQQPKNSHQIEMWIKDRDRKDSEITKQIDETRKIIADSIKDISREFSGVIKEKDNRVTETLKDISNEIKEMNNRFNIQIKDSDTKNANSIRDVTDKFTHAIKDITTLINDKIRDIGEDLKENKAEKRLRELEQKNQEKESLNTLKYEINNVQKDFATALSEIRTAINSKSGESSDKMMQVMFQAMTDSQGKIFEAVNKTLSDRMESMSESNKTFKELFLEMNRSVNEKNSTPNDPFESTERLVNIASALAGISKPGNEEDPNLPFESRLVKAFTDVTPQVLSYMRERKKQGIEVSEKEMEEKWKEAVASKAKELAKSQIESFKHQIMKKARELQANQQKQLTAGKQPTEEEVDEEVEKLAEDALDSSVEEQDEEMQPVKKEKEMNPNTKDHEIARRVNHVLSVIDQEIDLMPGEPEWIEHAIKYMPREQLVALSNAKDPKQLLPILQKYAEKDILFPLAMKLANQDKYKWLMRGLSILSNEVKQIIKEEHAAAAKQPAQKEKPQIVEDEEGIVDDSSSDIESGDIFDNISGTSEV